MLHPVGPLPPSVYWRRRALAGLGLVVAPALLIGGLAASCGDSTAAATAPDGTSASPVAATASAAALATPPGGQAGVLDPRAAPTGLTAPAVFGASTGSGSPAAGATAPSTPAAPRCADGALSVTARTDEPRYAAGADPRLSLVVTNTGSAPCTRDLDAARQALAVVRRPGEGLWGSNDCSPTHTDDVRTLAPGQEVVFSVRWSGRTSSPGCVGPRRDVPPGGYQLLARLDGLVSRPTSFELG